MQNLRRAMKKLQEWKTKNFNFTEDAQHLL